MIVRTGAPATMPALVHHRSKRLHDSGESNRIAQALRAETNGAKCSGNQKNSEDESCITNAIDDKRLLTCVRRGFLQKVETDQKVAAQPDTFPANKEQKEIVGKNESQHRKHEEIQIAEEAVIATFVRHVSDGINMDEKADARNDQNHHAGQADRADSPNPQ